MEESALKWDRIRQISLWIILPLVIGIIISLAIPRPVIGVIRLNDAIYSFTARDLINQINYAKDNPKVSAVVLVLDSPGGTVVDTEAIYMELTRLREKKPVVTVVNGMAASGAYYLSVNTDYIYAKPTSLVGNVGVIGYLPSVPFIYEGIISTGPYKLFGSPRDLEMRQIEAVKQGFFQAVMLGRGDRLNMDAETLLRGQIWSGSDSLELGIIDAFGTETDAAKKAASLAHVSHYDVVELNTIVQSGFQMPALGFFLQNEDGVTLPYPSEAGMYLLYVPPSPVKE